MDRVFLNALGIVNALGIGKQAVLDRLMSGDQSGFKQSDSYLTDGSVITVAAVMGNLPETPCDLMAFDSHNTRLLIAAACQIDQDIQAAIARFGPARVGVVMGTSTSGIDEGEKALAIAQETGTLPDYYDVRRQEIGSTGETLARYLGLEGLALTVSTACNSGAKAFATARRLLKVGLVDAVLVGGVDSLCQLTLNGFYALSALSSDICNPFSKNRDGTTIGEGAAVFLMTKEACEIELLGVGESSDAYSMTSPDPTGKGAAMAMEVALLDAGLKPCDLSYVNLHGTGTDQNDAMESRAMNLIFDHKVLCSSAKGQIGHTLGAAGAIETALCWLTASSLNQSKCLPPHLWDHQADDGLLSDQLTHIGQNLPISERIILMSNSYAFGGNNASVIIGRS